MSRFTYGQYYDGPDPLAPPVDLRDALDAIGRDVMDGRSPRSALEELLRRGTQRDAGLDELTRRLWERRSQIQRRHNLDGTLQQVRELLDQGVGILGLETGQSLEASYLAMTSSPANRREPRGS